MRDHRLFVQLRCAAVVAFLAALSPFAAAARADVEGEGLVRKAIHVSESLNWRGSYSLGTLDSGQMFELRFDVQSIDGQSTTTLDVSSIDPQAAVVTRDRREGTDAHPEDGAAVTTRASSAAEPSDNAQFQVLDEALFFENFSADSLRSEDVLGHPARVVRVQTRSELPRASFLLWLDASTGFPYRVDRHDSDGTLSSSIRYLSFESLGAANLAGKTPMVVRFQSASDSPDEARRAVTHFIAPETLPGGFHIGGLQVRKTPGDPAVAIRYSDGLNEILVLESDSRPLRDPNPDALRDPTLRDRARRLMRDFDHQRQSSDPNGDGLVARSRSFGSITSVIVRSDDLTAMAIGPLTDQALARILEALYR